MRTIRESLHEKRKATEDHIRTLRQGGENAVRYTAMMPDLPFLVLGLISDIGWMAHLIAGGIYFCTNGVRHIPDIVALFAMAGVLFGVVCLMVLNRIREKEIARRYQKNLGFGMTVFAGLAGAVIGIVQMCCAGVSTELVWIVIGGFLNFASGLPIFLSFRKGIFYGVK